MCLGQPVVGLFDLRNRDAKVCCGFGCGRRPGRIGERCVDNVACIDAEECTDCGACVDECPNEALTLDD